ncbi:MAG: molybdopterin molybdotransferase MoeA [Coriobacteriales bacterium]|jgi:molybdopterin molybdotransferase|nr:molybdopterin molybdotransferase MoeA [Coriobacteriales bacterium]
MHSPYSEEKMISVEDALASILALVKLLPTESVPLNQSIGRVLAADVVADIDIAPFSSSCMDGFAICQNQIAQATSDFPIKLNIVGVLAAGSVYDGTLQPGEALRIMTGAPMPNGADTVVKIEDTLVEGISETNAIGTQVCFSFAPKVGANVREPGEEAKCGQTMLRKGELINPAGVGLLAGCGATEVKVYRQPRVAVFSTGSELVEPSQRPGPGQIRNTNSYALAAYAQDAGAIVTQMPLVADTAEAFSTALLNAVENHDLIILSGGAAEGDFDFTTKTVRDLGELIFNKVCMRPGKAQTLGVVRGVPIFGLPGNPAAAAIGFEVLLRPALRKMQGHSNLQRPITRASLSADTRKDAKRRSYMRANLSKDANGNFIVTAATNQSSALYRTLYESNCLLVIPEGDELAPAGKIYDCLRIDLTEGSLI